MFRFHGRHPPSGPTGSVEECENYMHIIEIESARLTKAIQKKYGIDEPRSSHKGGWSLMYDALKAQLVALIKIRRHVTGEHRQEKWQNDQRLRAKLPAILDVWETRVASHELPDAQVEEVLHGTGRGLRWWKQQVTLPTRALCDHEIEAVKKLLQGRARTDLRKRISHKVRQRELLRKSGQWRGVIKSLLGAWAGPRHRDSAGEDVLRKRDGSTTTTSKESTAS